jgi:hypothetical protein
MLQIMADSDLKTGIIFDIVGMSGARTLIPLFWSHIPSEDKEWCKWSFLKFKSV